MSRSRDNADAVTTVPSGVGRNMIINGAMNVAQRSASVTGIGAADGYFTLDRWHTNVGATSAGRLTQTQTADGPNGISANCLKLDCTTADTSIAAGEYLGVWHKFEGHNVQRIGKGVAGAKQVTVSFYVKANATATYLLELEDADNSRTNGKLFPVTTDWVRQELVFEADVDDGSSPLNDDNGNSLVLAWYIHGGSNFTSGTLASGWENTTAANRLVGIDSFFSSTNNTLFITGVQLEVGPVATEFEQEDISTTLQKCQRYFCKVTGSSGAAYQRFARGHCASTTSGAMGTFLPQNMRAFPTLGSTGTASNYAVHHGAGTTALSANPATEGGSDAFLSNSTNNHVVIVATTAADGLTAGQGCSLNANGSEAAFLSFDSEL